MIYKEGHLGELLGGEGDDHGDDGDEEGRHVERAVHVPQRLAVLDHLEVVRPSAGLQGAGAKG